MDSMGTFDTFPNRTIRSTMASTAQRTLDPPSAGLFTIRCQAFDWVGQVTCDSIKHIHIVNPAFLARGDYWTDAMSGAYDDVRQMYPVPGPTNVVDWPTWAFFCDAAPGPIADYPDIHACRSRPTTTMSA